MKESAGEPLCGILEGLSKILLIKGDESVHESQLELSTGAQVTTCEGSYSAVSKADSHGTDFDATVWSGHGGYDGPNFHNHGGNETKIAICQETDGSWRISAKEMSQPASGYHSNIQVHINTGPGIDIRGFSWISNLEKEYGVSFESGSASIPTYLEGFLDYLEKHQHGVIFRVEMVDGDTSPHRDGSKGLELDDIAPAIKNATKDSGFIYLGSCNSGRRRGDFYEDHDSEFRFSQALANETDRTVFASQMESSAQVTATNMSRLINREEDERCNVKLQNRTKCFIPS